ncbi:MAG TPA: type II secretion system F family protein [Ensifer sp.]|nr:type II secretion system F family protein [Ensifer sp.]
MFYDLAATITRPGFIFAVLIALAVFGTLYVVAEPYFERGDLQKRMKAVATEREQLRARERARMNAAAQSRANLRGKDNKNVRNIVERLNLRKALVDDATINKLRAAGYRSQNALNTYLFARLVLPFVFGVAGAFWIFFLDNLADQALTMRLLANLVIAYVGFYAPIIFISNKMGKRQSSIRRAWPDSLDLMLICVESGVSVEASLRRVADEIGMQSPELAEELVLTTAELSYLQDRRSAYENLANRTQLEPVKSTTQALIQAERYGTPVAQALRTLAQESRDTRMNEAEKKAAALPPKLTVPMILFFLPVLIAVILGPAGIRVSDQMSGVSQEQTTH